MNKYGLTKEQINTINGVIDEWYQIWKSRITPKGVPHTLSLAKENLKNRLDRIDENSITYGL